MKLAVITHTKGTSKWFQAAVDSVTNSLPPEAEHFVIPCTDFESGRLASLDLGEYLAFVDDDDEVNEGALALCLKAIEETGVGVAFTDQVQIDADGKVLREDTGTVTPGHILCSPQAIHHLAVIRSSSISPKVFSISEELGVGVDWMIKASAALQHGSVHVPMIGYKWRRYSGQHSVANTERFNRCFDRLSAHAKSWKCSASKVQTYKV